LDAKIAPQGVTIASEFTALVVLAAMLMASRLTMVLGLGRNTPNPLRTAGNLLQWGMIMASSIYGLSLALLAG